MYSFMSGGGGGGGEAPAVSLIEPTAKSFLYRTLQKCHEMKLRYFSIWLNIIIFVLFVTVVSFVLYSRYKGQPSEIERRQKLIRDQQYILSKIRYYHDEKKRSSFTDIIDIPVREARTRREL